MTKAVQNNAVQPDNMQEVPGKTNRRASVQNTHVQLQARLNSYEKKQSFVLHPQKSSFFKKWDVIVGLALVFTAIVTPPEVAFLETKIDGLFVVNRFFDLVFVMDIVVNFHLGYFDKDQRMWVLDKSKIRQHYMRGSFFLDVISTFPFDMLGVIMPTPTCEDAENCGNDETVAQLKMLRLLKILKLLKLARILKASRILKKIQAELKLTHAAAALLKFLIGAILVVHWVACLWGIGASMEAGSKDNNGNDAITWVIEASAQQEAPEELYLRCLEFSIMAMVMGYGAIEPVNVAERLLACFSMALAGSFYGFMIGSICSILSKNDPAQQMFREKSDLVTRFLQENELPPGLGIRLQEYFANCEQLFRNQLYGSVCTVMSPALQREIAFCIHSKSIAGIPYLNADDESERAEFVAALSLKLKPVAFPPNEEVYTRGEPANYMMIISRGMASVSGTMARDNKIIREKGHFGQNMVLPAARRMDTVRSLTYLNCNKLTRQDLQSLLTDEVDGTETNRFPQTTAKIRRFRAQLHMQKIILTIRNIFSLTAEKNRLGGTGWTKEQYAEYRQKLLDIGKEKGKKAKRSHVKDADTICPPLTDELVQQQSRVEQLYNLAGKQVVEYCTKIVDEYVEHHHPQVSQAASTVIVPEAINVVRKRRKAAALKKTWSQTKLSAAARATLSEVPKDTTNKSLHSKSTEQLQLPGEVKEQLRVLTRFMEEMDRRTRSMQSEIGQIRKIVKREKRAPSLLKKFISPDQRSRGLSPEDRSRELSSNKGVFPEQPIRINADHVSGPSAAAWGAKIQEMQHAYDI